MTLHAEVSGFDSCLLAGGLFVAREHSSASNVYGPTALSRP